MGEVDSPAGRQNASPWKSWTILGLIIAGTAFWLLQNGATTCKALTNDVLAASKENASAIQPKMIDLVDIKTISNKDDELECSGIGIFSNGKKQSVSFRKYREYEKWWVKYEGTGAPF